MTNIQIDADFNNATIQRHQHDESTNFTIISNHLIRNSSISPNCRWLLIYLLSNDKKWIVKFSQVADHVKEFIGRDSLYNIFNEAIEAGYIKREKKTVNNLARYTYYVSETPKFKKCFRCPGFQDTGGQDPENQGTKEENKKEIKKKEIKESSSSKPSSSFSTAPPASHKNKSLRSEEEDFSYEILNETTLSPAQKKRLTREFSHEEVDHALKISKTQTVKKSLMGMLLTILKNPDSWQYTVEERAKSPNEQLALHYNQLLSKVDPKLALKNAKLIEDDCIIIILNGLVEKASIKSDYFADEIKRAMRELEKK